MWVEIKGVLVATQNSPSSPIMENTALVQNRTGDRREKQNMWVDIKGVLVSTQDSPSSPTNDESSPVRDDGIGNMPSHSRIKWEHRPQRRFRLTHRDEILLGLRSKVPRID